MLLMMMISSSSSQSSDWTDVGALQDPHSRREKVHGRLRANTRRLWHGDAGATSWTAAHRGRTDPRRALVRLNPRH